MTNWFEAEFILLKVLKLQPSELDRMEFYRAEILIENLKNYNEEEEGKNRNKEEGLDPNNQASQMMKDAQKNFNNIKNPMANFKMPSLPKFK